MRTKNEEISFRRNTYEKTRDMTYQKVNTNDPPTLSQTLVLMFYFFDLWLFLQRASPESQKQRKNDSTGGHSPESAETTKNVHRWHQRPRQERNNHQIDTMAHIAWQVRNTTGVHNLESTETINKKMTPLTSNKKLTA